MSRQKALLRQVNRGRAIITTLGSFKVLVKTKCLLPTMHTTSFTNMMRKQVSLYLEGQGQCPDEFEESKQIPRTT